MEKSKSLDFLNSCLDFFDNLKDSDIAKLKQVYEEEMRNDFGKSEFELLLPEQNRVPVCEKGITFSVYMPIERKKMFDYNMPVYKEATVSSVGCMAA